MFEIEVCQTPECKHCGKPARYAIVTSYGEYETICSNCFVAAGLVSTDICVEFQQPALELRRVVTLAKVFDCEITLAEKNEWTGYILNHPVWEEYNIALVDFDAQKKESPILSVKRMLHLEQKLYIVAKTWYTDLCGCKVVN